jgi:hypothetical protein
MQSKRELAEKIAVALGRPGDEATIASYQVLPLLELQLQAEFLPGVVDRLKAEGHWAGTPGAEPCGLCGEDADAEMGEFWDAAKDESVYAHAQCGVDAGLPLA